MIQGRRHECLVSGAAEKRGSFLTSPAGRLHDGSSGWDWVRLSQNRQRKVPGACLVGRKIDGRGEVDTGSFQSMC